MSSKAIKAMLRHGLFVVLRVQNLLAAHCAQTLYVATLHEHWESMRADQRRHRQPQSCRSSHMHSAHPLAVLVILCDTALAGLRGPEDKLRWLVKRHCGQVMVKVEQ